jgi:hypothetical protein
VRANVLDPSAVQNFKRLLGAASTQDLYLVGCKQADTGRSCSVICLINENFAITPLGMIFAENPYAYIEAPTLSSPKFLGEIPQTEAQCI